MLSTPLNFVAGTRQIGKVTRVNFERSMRNANSPLRMPRGKVGPKIETTKSRRPRPEPKIKGAPVRRRNEELTKEVNTFIAGVATRLTKSAMLYSPPRFDYADCLICDIVIHPRLVVPKSKCACA